MIGGHLILKLEGHAALSTELNRHPVAAYLASLSEGSRRAMFTALRAVLAIGKGGGTQTEDIGPHDVWAFPWAKLEFSTTNAIRAKLQGRFSPAYANKCLAALRGVLKNSWRLGLMSRDEYARAVDLKPVRVTTLPAGQDLSAGEQAALMLVCSEDLSPAGPRDAAIIGWGLCCGPRIAEVANAMMHHYDPITQEIRIAQGKGHKERLNWLLNGSADAMADWLHYRGDEPGHLFCPVSQSGLVRVASLSPASIRKMLAKRAKQAGMKAFTFHDLRRSCAGDLLDLSVDVVLVSRILGHASVTQTARYDRRPQEAIRAGLKRRHIPYQPRFRPSPEISMD